MEISIKTTYKIKYKVEYFEAEEGGMDHDTFGKESHSLSDIINTLEIANKVHPDIDWIITLDIDKKVEEK